MGLGLSLGIGWRGFGVNFGIWGMVGDGLRAIYSDSVVDKATMACKLAFELP